MIDDAAALGYGEYRTHLALMDQVAGTYNFNDGAIMKYVLFSCGHFPPFKS